MQDAAKIQDSLDHQTDHQEAKAAVVQEQLTNVQRNMKMAETELAKFRVLREGLNVGMGVLNQQFTQIKNQPEPNPVSVTAFEGAIGHLEGLVKQADLAIAKNEGSFMAFQAMEQQFKQQVDEAVARQRVLGTQAGNAVALAEQGQQAAPVETVVGVEVGDTTVEVEDTTESVEALIAAVGEDEEPTPAPIATPRKTTSSSSKKGRGRKKKQR